MESGENPEQSRCGIRRRIPKQPIFAQAEVKAGRRRKRGEIPISTVGSPNTSPASTRPGAAPFTEPQSTVLAFPRKEGDENRNDGGGLPPSSGRRVLFLTN